MLLLTLVTRYCTPPRRCLRSYVDAAPPPLPVRRRRSPTFVRTSAPLHRFGSYAGSTPPPSHVPRRRANASARTSAPRYRLCSYAGAAPPPPLVPRCCAAAFGRTSAPRRHLPSYLGVAPLPPLVPHRGACLRLCTAAAQLLCVPLTLHHSRRTAPSARGRCSASSLLHRLCCAAHSARAAPLAAAVPLGRAPQVAASQPVTLGSSPTAPPAVTVLPLLRLAISGRRSLSHPVFARCCELALHTFARCLRSVAPAAAVRRYLLLLYEVLSARKLWFRV